MELPTLTLTRDDAKTEVQRFRRARRDGIVLTREDQRMLQAYEAIAKGRTVIDLHRALALGGIEAKTYERSQYRPGKDGGPYNVTITTQLPRLAVGRADHRWAWCSGIGRDGTVSFRHQREMHHAGRPDFQAVEVFPRDDTRRTVWGGEPTWRALLPPIPPHLRPTRTLRGQRVELALTGFHVLWEAEWQLDRTVPPGDPALLRHLGGNLYTVEATWDLTPVEQAVLAGREPTAQELSWRA